MKKQLKFLFLIVSLAAGLLAACSPVAAPAAVQNPAGAPQTSSSDSQPSASNSLPLTSDACALLPREAVSSILGVPVDNIQGNGLGPLGGCLYTAKSLTFQLNVMPKGGAKYLQGIRTSIGQSALDVSNLGDEAIYNTMSNILLVRKGDAEYDFSVSDSSLALSVDAERAMEKALAEKLLGGIK